MNSVQFDPKIATDLQIDWRRHESAQNSDLFADLLSDRLKRPIDTDKPDRHAWRSHAAPDALSGRPPRLVIAHARTIRGEAKEVEDTADRRLPDHTDCAQDKSGAVVVEEPTETADAETTASSEAEAETDAGVPDDRTAEAAAEQSEADPTATLVVAVQPAAEKATDGTLDTNALLPIAAPAEDQGVAPAQAENAENAAADGSEANTDGAAEQQAAVAMAEASLSDLAATLINGETASADEPKPDLTLSPETATPVAANAGEQPLLQMPEAPAPVPEIAPAQPQPARPAMDIKLRPGAATRAHAAADPAPSSSATPQSQPHQAALQQPAAAGEFGAAGETYDQPLSADGSGPGWAFHLAQGAAGKRADFVAQLRQHLQNLPAHEQVAVHIQRAVREGTGRFSIQLSPAELGNIHVKLEIDEEKRVSATVTVERPSTLELLQRDTKGLERALHNAGLNMEGGDLSFSLGRGSDQEFAQDMNRSAASAAGGAVLDGGSDADQSDGLAAEVLDTAAGVVNLQV